MGIVEILLELTILLAKCIQVDGTPKAGSFAPNDDYKRTIYS